MTPRGPWFESCAVGRFRDANRPTVVGGPIKVPAFSSTSSASGRTAHKMGRMKVKSLLELTATPLEPGRRSHRRCSSPLRVAPASNEAQYERNNGNRNNCIWCDVLR